MKHRSEVFKLTWAALTASYALPSKVEVIRPGNLINSQLVPAEGVDVNSENGVQQHNAMSLSYDWTAASGTLFSIAPFARTQIDGASTFRPILEGHLSAGAVTEVPLEMSTAAAAGCMKPFSILERSIAIKAKTNIASGSAVVYLTLGNL